MAQWVRCPHDECLKIFRAGRPFTCHLQKKPDHLEYIREKGYKDDDLIVSSPSLELGLSDQESPGPVHPQESPGPVRRRHSAPAASPASSPAGSVDPTFSPAGSVDTLLAADPSSPGSPLKRSRETRSFVRGSHGMQSVASFNSSSNGSQTGDDLSFQSDFDNSEVPTPINNIYEGGHIFMACQTRRDCVEKFLHAFRSPIPELEMPGYMRSCSTWLLEHYLKDPNSQELALRSMPKNLMAEVSLLDIVTQPNVVMPLYLFDKFVSFVDEWIVPHDSSLYSESHFLFLPASSSFHWPANKSDVDEANRSHMLRRHLSALHHTRRGFGRVWRSTLGCVHPTNRYCHVWCSVVCCCATGFIEQTSHRQQSCCELFLS